VTFNPVFAADFLVIAGWWFWCNEILVLVAVRVDIEQAAGTSGGGASAEDN
jgi:hypothetical protein